jgi:uncharacterized protein (DUF433 family)
MATPKPERGAPREPYNIPIRVYGDPGGATGRELAALKRLLRDLQEAVDRCVRSLSGSAPGIEPGKTDWRSFIFVNRRILGGKPVVKGTNVTVDSIMRALRDGETPELVRFRFNITEDELRAAFWYATESPAALADSPRRRGRAG